MELRTPPKPYEKVYFVIRCTRAKPTGEQVVAWINKNLESGYWQDGRAAERFTEFAQAKRVYNYLEKRKTTPYGQVQWGRFSFEIIKVVATKTIEVEHPLGVLEKLAKV